MNIRFKSLYSWSIKWADTKWGPLVLFLFAFTDSSILPTPVTTFFLILIVLNAPRTLKYIQAATLGTLAGALAGYMIGHFAGFNATAEQSGIFRFLINNIPGLSESSYQKIHLLYSKWDFWILLVATCTPVPYFMFSISSGAFDINIIVFLFSTLISQGIKFSILALATIKFGNKIEKLRNCNWQPIAIIVIAGIVAAIAISNAV